MAKRYWIELWEHPSSETWRWAIYRGRGRIASDPVGRGLHDNFGPACQGAVHDLFLYESEVNEEPPND